MNNDELRSRMEVKNLSKYACPYSKELDFRPTFYRDIDRILYSLAYTRYLDKTQVFTHGGNDHLQRRMTHVQFVSKIARTIGRALSLNEDLIEAAALGHDLGHTPFGHLGESILNEISLENGMGYFNHNIESVRVLMNIENYGQGLNITIPVLDAIMCHNGEVALGKYEPFKKSKKQFLKEYELAYKDKEVIKNMRPMTLEGCVVRISDLIAYLGKDIEDGIRCHLITKEDIPEDITTVLGSSNKEIVNTIITDIIKNSYDRNFIKLSDEVYEAMEKLKSFNYKYIYAYAASEEEKNNVRKIFTTLFNVYLEDLESENKDSIIYTNYLNNMSEEYLKTPPKRIVIDYLAGMTDEYIVRQYNNLKETHK